MLQDISKITQEIISKFEPENKALECPKSCYDVYRKLALVIEDANLVAEHYLTHDFSDPVLQNSSFEKPSDKWRFFLNKDLKTLNESIKEYLLKITGLSLEDASGLSDSLISEKYNPLYFFAFVRDEYSVGHVDPCGFSLVCVTLKTKVTDNRSVHIKQYKRDNLQSHESRVALQKSIREQKQLLEEELEKLKSYIQKNYTLEALL